jgi:hypothetical protein
MNVIYCYINTLIQRRPFFLQHTNHYLYISPINNLVTLNETSTQGTSTSQGWMESTFLTTTHVTTGQKQNRFFAVRTNGTKGFIDIFFGRIFLLLVFCIPISILYKCFLKIKRFHSIGIIPWDQ